MAARMQKGRKLNRKITQQIIGLQENGYFFDFLLSSCGEIICIQNNMVFPFCAISVKVIDQAWDQLTKSYKYIHTVDTGNEEKGLLIVEQILICSNVSQEEEGLAD
ncbi:MAG TPA: hypothetical protein VGM63_20720 [Mucilaginibacter sp.]|jgi:hypothetical protein